MKIYDPQGKVELKEVTIFLTPQEAEELAFSARDLAENPTKHHHHVSNTAYNREITISVYTAENIAQFDSQSRELLKGEL